MPKEYITSGYLDVKISAKVKRGFTPWKAWRKQWCEIKHIDNVDNGVEIRLKSHSDNGSSNCFVISRNATLCRTESRTKTYSFGIFEADRHHKPLLFLSGASETDSQLWMLSIRRMLSLNSHLPIPGGGFYVSIVDNDHSRIAGLTGLHGTLTINTHEFLISDPCTGDVRTRISWYSLHQFHLAAVTNQDDEQKIVIFHTNKDFRAGAGQFHLFCLQAPHLLNLLVDKGKIPKIYINCFMDSRRMSRSEGDLRDSEDFAVNEGSVSPSYYHRSHSDSDDSGVRVSMASDDSNLVLKCKKAASFISLGLLVATPGGSEIDAESYSDLLLNNEENPADLLETIPFNKKSVLDLRRESGVSVLSGVYEEIPDLPSAKEFENSEPRKSSLHMYEDPVDIILTSLNKLTPPPLPPRHEAMMQSLTVSEEEVEDVRDNIGLVSFSQTTTPKRSKIKKSKLIDLESKYMVRSGKQPENFYVPMNSTKQIVEEENGYMIMKANKSK